MALSATCLWATVGEIKPWLRLEPTDVAHDDMLALRAESVTNELERETGRIFVSRAVTEVRNGHGRRRLELHRYPVTAITSITLDEEVLSTDDYSLESEPGIVTLVTGVWTEDVANVTVVYTAGYARASVPSEVQELALDLLKIKYATWGTNTDTYSSVGIGGTTLQPAGDWVNIRKRIDAIRTAIRLGGPTAW